MKTVITIGCCFLLLIASAQHNKELGIALTNSNTVMPFSKFSGLFESPFHPGAELSYGFNWKSKDKHDWYQQIKLGYFYHRFVQHGIPLYTNIGYRYKFSSHLFTEAALGAGYLHSIPATAQFKLSSNGEYQDSKGIGRMQAIVLFNISAGYTIDPAHQKRLSLFATYQQRIQMPFVRSYVPLLPYNSLMIGARMRVKTTTITRVYNHPRLF